MLPRALKTKHDTPKYGLIYGASLVGQSAPKNKGKISRMLAAKASLCVRVDALGEDSDDQIGVHSRAMVEERLRQYEQCKARRISGTGKVQARAEKYEMSRFVWICWKCLGAETLWVAVQLVGSSIMWLETSDLKVLQGRRGNVRRRGKGRSQQSKLKVSR